MGNRRVLVMAVILGLGWSAIVARVFYVQVLQGPEFREMARQQSVRRHIIPARRGRVLDINRKELVINADVKIEASMGEGNESYLRPLKRLCPFGPLAGQVLGTIGTDGYGMLGLEYIYDNRLRGTDGWRYARQDVAHRFYPEFESRETPPRHGADLVLTIDMKIQEIAERALERGVQRTNADAGVALVIEPYRGDILAMANYPFFDPNRGTGWEEQAWKNQGIVKVYEPGSTFKAVTAACLLQEGLLIPEDTIFAENGTWTIYGETIRDTKGHGKITFTEAMAYSSNIAFAKIVEDLSYADYFRYVRSFGFGMKTGIGLPAEESGTLKPVATWSGRTQSTMAFGHEVSVTPIQLAMAFGAIANGGVLMRPRVTRGWNEPDGVMSDTLEPRKVRRVISEEVASQLRSMLKAVVDSGTAANIRSEWVSIAGKTGTAEKIDPETGKYLKDAFHSSFVGMAPAENPEVVILVLIDNPKKDKYGGSSAGPVFAEILDRMISKGELSISGKKPGAGDSAHSMVSPNMLGYDGTKLKEILDKSLIPYRVDGHGVKVVSQEPSPGVKMGMGDTLVLHLGLPQSEQMPDLSSLSLRDALLRLRHLGLEVEYEGTGNVTGQNPKPGAPVKRGQICKLNLGWNS